MSWGYQDILGPKIIKKNQQVFMHNFACQNVLTFPLYILLTKRITTLWSESIDTFWSGATETIWHRKSQKDSNIHIDIFHYTNFFIPTFLCKTVQKSPFYILSKLLTTWLTLFSTITHTQIIYFQLSSYYCQ